MHHKPEVPIGVYFQACYNPVLEAEMELHHQRSKRYIILPSASRALPRLRRSLPSQRHKQKCFREYYSFSKCSALFLPKKLRSSTMETVPSLRSSST